MIHPTAIIGEAPESRDVRHDPGFTAAGVDIAPTATIEALVTVDAGVQRATRIGARAWLMKKVHVGHDAIVGDDCEVAPLSSVGGYVELGDGVRVGQGAVFLPRVTVGAGARIGAGAVVVKSVPPGEVWAGNPARSLRSPATGVLLTPSEEEGWEDIASRAAPEWEEWWERVHR